MSRDVSSILSRKLEREEKRIRIGLLKLGMKDVKTRISAFFLYIYCVNYSRKRIAWCKPK